MRFEHEAAPVRIHERVAFTSVDLLSSIVTTWAAGLGGLDALAVDDSRRGASRPTRSRSACPASALQHVLLRKADGAEDLVRDKPRASDLAFPCAFKTSRR